MMMEALMKKTIYHLITTTTTALLLFVLLVSINNHDASVLVDAKTILGNNDNQQYQHQHQHGRRRLSSSSSLPPVVAPEVSIIIDGIPSLDNALIQYETPITIRFTNYYTAMWWNCIAIYSSKNYYLDALTKVRPSVPVLDTTQLDLSSNYGICVAQSTATMNVLVLPNARKGWKHSIQNTIGVIVDDELNIEIETCGDTGEYNNNTIPIQCLQNISSTYNYNPKIMGHIVAKLTYDYMIYDGFNQLGHDEGCQVNCRPYSSSSYEPVNDPYLSRSEFLSINQDRWQPLLEDNSKGFFYFQEHVTPHIGDRAKFRYLPESDRTDRVAVPPNYTTSRQIEAETVIERMKQALVSDEKKIAVEQFDDKLVVGGAIAQAFILKLLSDGYQDQEFGIPGLVVSFPRFVHFLQTIFATTLDATIIAWKEKVKFDLIRPTTVIKNWDNQIINTWATSSGDNGVIQSYMARDFEAYQRVMPHSEYVSASACIFTAEMETVETYLNDIGLDASSFPIRFPMVPKGRSLVETGYGPLLDVQLTFPNMTVMAYEGGQSRLDGGMHFEQSIPAAEQLCTGIGPIVVQGSRELITEPPPSQPYSPSIPHHSIPHYSIPH